MPKLDIEAALKEHNKLSIEDALRQEQLVASQQKQSWGDVATQAIVNTPQSAVNFAKGIYQSVRHPIDTGENLLKAGAGAVRNLIPAEYQSQRPEAIKASQTADAIGQFYKQRYGSMEGVKNAIATDPVGVMADASAILSGGAAITPKASKLGQILSRAGEVTNPVKMATTAAGSVLNPTARALMNSALKPTIEQHRKGDAAVAVDTLLKYGISPTQKGVMKVHDLIDELNTRIADKVNASNATINRGDVLHYLKEPMDRFGNQVSPSSDLAAISNVADDFMGHPAIQAEKIPVKLAQKLKQGTYKALKGKYGEVGSASTEAQKALARGLKENIAEVVPGIGALNAEESRLFKTLGVAERRSLMDMNKNPLGLAALAGNPTGFAAFMADRSAAFKALVARMMNRTGEAADFTGQHLATPALVSGVAGNAMQDVQR